jgi:heat shock protein HspQ
MDENADRVAIRSKMSIAKFGIGQVIRHRLYEFRGVVFDVDPEFADGNGTHEAIMVESRSRRDQPFYYLFAENDRLPYIAYVSEQNLLADMSGEPVSHPQIDDLFEHDPDGGYRRRNMMMN